MNETSGKAGAFYDIAVAGPAGRDIYRMIIALIAMGVSLIWGVMYIVNFAHGEILMLGMFISYYFSVKSGLDPLLCLPIAAVVMYCFGIVFYKVLIKRVMNAPMLSQLLLTYALSIVLVNVAQIAFGSDFKTVPNQIFTGSFSAGGLIISYSKLVPFIICIVTAVTLYYILNRTQLGRAIKATALNKDAAALVGINPEKAYMRCVGIAAATAGIGGVALSYYFYVYPSVGSVFINFGFVACCIGGMGSIPGAVIGGVLMGIMDTVVGTYTNAALKYLAVFALFLLVVYKRPKGLFGW